MGKKAVGSRQWAVKSGEWIVKSGEGKVGTLHVVEQAACGSATLADLRAAIGGRHAACGFATLADPSDTLVGPIVSDSRKIKSGDVFWTLRGPNYRGGDFIGEAFSRGAVGAVVNKDVALDFSHLPIGDGPASSSPLPMGKGTMPNGRWIVRVDDTHRALNDWARWRRRQFAGTVIGVTGSAGKSTTREMIHAVLGS